MKLFSTPNAPKLLSMHSIAFYEPASGRIRFLHHHAFLEGCAEMSKEEIHSYASRLAERAGVNVKEMEMLYLKDHSFEQGKSYRVNPASKALESTGIHDKRGPAPRR